MSGIIAAVASSLAISWGMAAYVVVMAVVTLSSVAYSAYMMATMETPNQPDATKRTQTVRSSVQPHRVIYGECMTGGVLVYAQSHSVNPASEAVEAGANKYITLVVAFTGHEVEEIKEVWLNDKLSTDAVFVKHIPYQPEEGYYADSPSRGDVSGPDPASWVITKAAVPAHDETFSTIYKYTGTADQTANEFLISLPAQPTTIISKNPTSGLNNLIVNTFAGAPLGTYNQPGMCTITLTVTAVSGSGDTVSWVQSTYSGDGSSVINKASGSFVMPGPNASAAIVDGIVVWFGYYSPHGSSGYRVNTGHSVGQSWEIRAFDGAPWTADCRLRGRSYVVVTLEYNNDAFPTGLPNIKALIKGNNQIYDPRTGTIGYTDNWALCTADYMAAKYGLGSSWPARDAAFAAIGRQPT